MCDMDGLLLIHMQHLVGSEQVQAGKPDPEDDVTSVARPGAPAAA